jgi:hypothetical protein
MRENRLYGSEGGEVKSLPYPYQGSAAARQPIGPRLVRPRGGSLKRMLHDQFLGTHRRAISWRDVCLGTLARTASARGNGNAWSTSTSSARVIPRSARVVRGADR